MVPNILQTTVLILLQSLQINSSSSGARIQACEYMTPRHGSHVPQSSQSPYTIQVEGGEYTPETPVKS